MITQGFLVQYAILMAFSKVLIVVILLNSLEDLKKTLPSFGVLFDTLAKAKFDLLFFIQVNIYFFIIIEFYCFKN